MENGTFRYYHFDALGWTDRLTDGSQNVTDTAEYDPWGKMKEKRTRTGTFFFAKLRRLTQRRRRSEKIDPWRDFSLNIPR